MRTPSITIRLVDLQARREKEAIERASSACSQLCAMRSASARAGTHATCDDPRLYLVFWCTAFNLLHVSCNVGVGGMHSLADGGVSATFHTFHNFPAAVDRVHITAI